jgi:hypothetical protein
LAVSGHSSKEFEHEKTARRGVERAFDVELHSGDRSDLRHEDRAGDDRVLQDQESGGIGRGQGSNATVPELRAAFDRQMQIDQVAFSSKDVDIHKNPRGAVVISVDYEKRIPLFANVSLVIDYKASTAE